MAAAANKLPKKEQDSFKALVNAYETKQYKKGIKYADQVLKSFPNHGETLAMKGLVVHSMGKKDEAYELVRSGIKNDIRSHVCWHVYGLIYKGDGNYKEAIKCYLNALRIDPENQNILRDLSWLQLQMRDFSGYLSTRGKILETRPSFRASWVAFAVANYLNNDYATCYSIIDKFYEGVSERAEAYEESELVLFQNRCLEKQGKYAEAIKHFNDNATKILDKLFVRVKTAECLVLSGNFDQALEKWSQLVREQSENFRFHCGLQCALLRLDEATSKSMFALRKLDLPCTVLSLTEEQKTLVKSYYMENAFKSRAVPKIMMFLTADGELEDAIKSHIKQNLRSGVPALYQDICSLIRKIDPNDNSRMITTKEVVEVRNHPIVIMVKNMLEGFITNLKASNTFGDETIDANVEKKNEEVPTCLLWALFLQSHLQELCGDYDSALHTIEEAIQHTPTALDMIVKKARILKKMGELQLAAQIMDNVRSLDLQDRFLNNKTTKYFLRTDKVENAQQTIAMFTKHEGNPEQTLTDLQCNWYELETAESHMRTKKWALALKKLYSVKKHFEDYVEDMLDFHAYCVRKTTLRMYIDTMQYQDSIMGHKFFQRAFRDALQVFDHLWSHPEDVKVSDPSERPVTTVEESKDKKDDEDSARVKDDDPLGDKLIVKDAKTEMFVWCNMLSSSLHLCDCDTLAVFAKGMVRCGKYADAVRALTIALEKDSKHSEINKVFVDFWMQSSKSEEIANEIKEQLQSLANRALSSTNEAVSIEKYVEHFTNIACELNSLSHRITAAHFCSLLNDKSKAHALLLDSQLWSMESRKTLYTDAIAAIAVVKNEFAEISESFENFAKVKYSRGDVFKSRSELDLNWQNNSGVVEEEGEDGNNHNK